MNPNLDLDQDLLDPFDRFQALFARAEKSEPEPTAMALATADPGGSPSVRIVLLKGLGESGFTFFTNYESRKGRELLQNPRASLCFFWKSLEVQVRAEGPVSPVSPAESDAYFRTRPRESRLGAWASPQSQPLGPGYGGRELLIDRYQEAERRFGAREEDGPVERPPHWGGFRLYPLTLEFWYGQRFRMHDRFLFSRSAAPGSPWIMQRLAP